MTSDNTRRIKHLLHEQHQAEFDRWLRRAEGQITFARAFLDVLPAEQTTGWAEQITQAELTLTDFNPEDPFSDLAEVVQEAEAAMADIGRAAKEYKIHCVGHGHIDMNWMWSWPETVATTHDTFASVLSLMREYPDFTYSQSQASVYALTERYYPAQFAEIQERVREGRWEITAAHWVEGDKNLASGESLCRHLLYARRYFEEKFGLSPEDLPVDWEPDTFGHAVTLPGILAQGAVKYYYSCRQGGGFDHLRVGPARPRLFWWSGPDGSRVLVNRESTWYNSYVNIGDNVALPLLGFVQETGLRDWLNVYGFGNHGGGPTRTELDWYRELQTWPVYPTLVYGTSKNYFDTISADLAARPGGDRLPVLEGELNFEFTGCYTTQTLIKQANRFGENYLEEAEALAVLGERLAGQTYSPTLLREAWRLVLFSQFHDILPGSGVRETREHCLAAFQEVGAITGAIKRSSGDALTRRVNTLSLLPDTWAGREERRQSEEGRVNPTFEAGAGLAAGVSGLSRSRGGGRKFRPYVVYNPCAWPRSERVTVVLYDTGFDPAHVAALDETGTAHPALVVERAEEWGHYRLSTAFDALDVPALGHRTYLLCEGKAETPSATVQATPDGWYETPWLRFRLDQERGGLAELWDKRTGVFLSEPGGCPLGAWAFVVERPRGMTAWVLGREVAEPLTLLSSGFGFTGGSRNGGTGVLENVSPLGGRATWHLDVPGTSSTVRLTLTIHALSPRLDFEAEVDWREIGDESRGIPGLTVRFPLALSGVTSRYEAPFGSVERSLIGGEEVPTLRYAHLSGTAKTADGTTVPAGVTLLQDCKYGHSVQATPDGTELRLRIVRSSFDPDPTPEVSKHTVRYALVLHDAPAAPSDLARLGAAWNHPLLPLSAGLHAGEIAPRQGFVSCDSPNVILTALKPAEEGAGFVVRLVETDGQACEAVVTFDPAFAAGLTQAQTLDVLERPADGTASLADGTLRVSVPALGIVTVGLS